MNGHEKSDPTVLAMKPTNKAGRPVAEPVERRVGTKGNANQHNTRRAQNRESVSQALDRIRQAARTRKKERFTALLHHVDIDLLHIAFLALKRDAAPGVDGQTWRDYEADLEPRLEALHDRVPGGLPVRGGVLGGRGVAAAHVPAFGAAAQVHPPAAGGVALDAAGPAGRHRWLDARYLSH